MTAVVTIMDAEMTPVPITVSAYLAMAARGDLPDRRIELLEGVIVELSPKGGLHAMRQAALLRWFNLKLPRDVVVYAEPTVRLDEQSAPQPDILLAERSVDPAALSGEDALLIVEVADTSLTKDLSPKALVYAAGGVREYWVVDVEAPRLHRHLDPSPTGYRSVDVFERDESAPLAFAPEIDFRLDDAETI